jgi:hypothetical protein
MRRYELVFAGLTAAVVLVNTCDASVVSMDIGYTWSGWLSGSDAHTYTWDFDYDLQLLTVQETILAFRPDASWGFGIDGRVDSDSTFSVVRTITNETGVTWTAYGMFAPPPPVGSGYVRPNIVYGTIEFTKFETVEHRYPVLEFSGPPFVLDGESFTMSFDMHAPYDARYDDPGRFHGGWGILIIPEPATLLLLGLGALVLRRRPKSMSALLMMAGASPKPS